MFIDKCSNKCKISKSRKLKVYYVSTMIKGECSILLKCQHTECLIGHDTKIQIFQSKCWNSHNPSKPYIDRYSIMQTHFYICLCLHWLRSRFQQIFLLSNRCEGNNNNLSIYRENPPNLLNIDENWCNYSSQWGSIF